MTRERELEVRKAIRDGAAKDEVVKTEDISPEEFDEVERRMQNGITV